MVYYKHGAKKGLMGLFTDRAFFLVSATVFTLLVSLIMAVVLAFFRSVYLPGDTQIFFRAADVIVKGGTPYVDFTDPKPPLIFFTLAIPSLVGQQLYGGLFMVGLCDLISAILVMKIAWKLYGRESGLFAGLFFLVNLIWAEGYFILTEPFALVFILLSLYALMFMGTDSKYLIAGICAGIAIGYKQYALLIIPLTILFLYLNRELTGALQYIAGVILPLAIVFAAIFIFFGVESGLASLHWSFGTGSAYLVQGYTGEITGYRISGPLMMAINFLMGMCIYTSLIILSVASFFRGRNSVYEIFFFIAGLAFASTVLIRPFFHYWTLALPFLVLLCAKRFATGQATGIGQYDGSSTCPGRIYGVGLSGRAYYTISAAIFSVILAGFAFISMALMSDEISADDLSLFYFWAATIVKGITPYIGVIDTAVSLAIPAAYWPGPVTGLLPVMACCLVSSMLIEAITCSLYGRYAGFIAGLLFTVNIGWVQGCMPVETTLALALVLTSTYLLIMKSSRGILLASGILTGSSFLLGPLTLIMLPIYLLRSGWRDLLHKASWLLAGAMVPALVLLACLFTLQGPDSLQYITISSIPAAILSLGFPEYGESDLMLTAANIVLSLTLFTSLLFFGIASYIMRQKDMAGKYFLLAGLAFLLTIFLRSYLNYWIFALAFMAILCSMHYRGAYSGDHITGLDGEPYA